MIHYVVISTGSCGNCYVIYDGETSILIDMGVTCTKLQKELEQHDIPLSSVSALFLTHLHPDHAKGAGALMRKMNIPVYISDVCHQNGKNEMMKAKIDINGVSTFKWGENTRIGSFSLTGFRTSHDSPGSSGYMITNNGRNIFLMTDTGFIPEDAYKYAGKSIVKFIEANYDEEMLLSGYYPAWLKERVRGPYGHLSNRDAVDFASSVSRTGDQIYFVHISKNNNDTALLKKEAESKMKSGIFLKFPERGEMFEGFID